MEATKAPDSLLDKFVFMDKALKILDVGLKTEKNVILYGPGGHGKSELTLEFFYEKQINPYIITMGTGMTTDRLFGGINIPAFEKEGKLEYLIENSFMNHEYVIFEEMMDAPDFILEQLKDILSSGIFRNGTQVYPIKTRFIVCCTNRTREEFSKNDSLRALMERFPLELNVIWDNYTEISYNTLLSKRYGVGQVDPIIPFILHEYVKNDITISPRIALDSYQIYEECGPESLHFIAEFAKKPALIVAALSKFQSVIKFKELGSEIEEIISRINENSRRSVPKVQEYVDDFKTLNDKYSTIKKMKVDDDMIHIHAELSTKIGEFIDNNRQKYNNASTKLSQDSVSKPPTRSSVERNVFDEGRAKRQAEAVTKSIFDEITDDDKPF
jgi:hypothetical protein